METLNINETITEQLTDEARRDIAFTQLNEVVDKLQAMPIFPSLLWTWTFDIIRDIYENNLTVEDWSEEVIRDGVTLKQIFDKFWNDVDNMGLSMDSGGEIIEETIRDWMRENDFLVALDDDGWLG